MQKGRSGSGRVHRTDMGGVDRGERNLTLQSVERIAEQIHVDSVVDLLGLSPLRTSGRRNLAAAESRTTYTPRKRRNKKRWRRLRPQRYGAVNPLIIGKCRILLVQSRAFSCCAAAASR